MPPAGPALKQRQEVYLIASGDRSARPMATTTASPAMSTRADPPPPATESANASNASPSAPTAAPTSAPVPSSASSESRPSAPPAPMTPALPTPSGPSPTPASTQAPPAPSDSAPAPAAVTSTNTSAAPTPNAPQHSTSTFTPANGTDAPPASGVAPGNEPAGGPASDQPPRQPANYQEFFSSLPPRQPPTGYQQPPNGYQYPLPPPTTQATFGLRLRPDGPYDPPFPTQLDGRVRDPVPARLKGMTDNAQGNFSVLMMKAPNIRAQEAKAREEEAKRTSEKTALAAKKAFQHGYVSFNKRPLREINPDLARLKRAIAGKPVYTQRNEPLTPEETKSEQARLLTVLRTISPTAVVDQLCKALGYFGGVPGFPPPENGVFPSSERANGSGSLFIGWLGEIFPKLDQNGDVIPEKRPRGRPKGSKATKSRKDKGVKKGPRHRSGAQASEDAADQNGAPDVDDSWVDADDDDNVADGAPGPSSTPRAPAPAVTPSTPARPAPAATPGSTGKRRGRPKGSKNKPKDPNAQAAPVTASQAAPAATAAAAVPPPVVTPIPPPVIPGLSAATSTATPTTGSAKKRGRGPAKPPQAPRPVQQGGSAFDYAVSALQASASVAATDAGSSQTTAFTPANPAQAPPALTENLTLTGKKRKRRSDAGKKKGPVANKATAATQDATATSGATNTIAEEPAPSAEAEAPPAKKPRKGRTSLPTGKASKGKGARAQDSAQTQAQPVAVPEPPTTNVHGNTSSGGQAVMADMIGNNDHEEDAAMLAPLAANNMVAEEPEEEQEEEQEEEVVEEAQEEDDFETDTYAALASQLEHDTASAQLHAMAAAMNTNQHHHQDNPVQRQVSQQSFSESLSPNLPSTSASQHNNNAMSSMTAAQQSRLRPQAQQPHIAQTVSPVPQQDSGYAQPSSSMGSATVMPQQQQQQRGQTPQNYWNQNRSSTTQYSQAQQTQPQQFTTQQQQPQKQYSSYQTQPQYQTAQQPTYNARHQQQTTANASPALMTQTQSPQFSAPQPSASANPYGTRSQSGGMQQFNNTGAYGANRRSTATASPATYATSTQHTASPAFGAPARPASTASNNSAASHGMQGYHTGFDSSNPPSLFGNVDVDAATASATGHGLGLGTSGYGTRSGGATAWGVENMGGDRTFYGVRR